jgi:hypothetical protein
VPRKASVVISADSLNSAYLRRMAMLKELPQLLVAW